jgi:NADH-quinone oxidoreductase subunit A
MPSIADQFAARARGPQGRVEKQKQNPGGVLGERREEEHKPMLQNYVPILIFMLVALAIGVALLVLGRLLAPYRPDSEKRAPYECGFEAFEDARMKFDVRYYLVAILFILFDLEIAFLFPWAVALGEIGMIGFVAMMIFLAILVVGFVYEWKKGALEWE